MIKFEVGKDIKYKNKNKYIYKLIHEFFFFLLTFNIISNFFYYFFVIFAIIK